MTRALVMSLAALLLTSATALATRVGSFLAIAQRCIATSKTARSGPNTLQLALLLGVLRCLAAHPHCAQSRFRLPEHEHPLGD